MEENRKLINRYKEGALTQEEEKSLEKLIAEGKVDMADLGLDGFQHRVDALETPMVSERMSEAFYAHLHSYEVKATSGWNSWWQSIWSARPAYQVAYSIVLLALGMLGGMALSGKDIGRSDAKFDKLSAEVSQMKEMMMLQLLDQESTSDRLKAVSLSEELPEASTKVTKALLKTLNEDANINVRLAALEALYPYAGEAQVREGLIAAIARQESPLVQVALAEVMVALQERRSVGNLEQILRSEDTPEEVKNRIKESIDILI